MADHIATAYPCEREVATEVVAILVLTLRPFSEENYRPPGKRERDQRIRAIALNLLMEGLAHTCGDDFHNLMIEACQAGSVPER
jgi:hypothetical protein